MINAARFRLPAKALPAYRRALLGTALALALVPAPAASRGRAETVRITWTAHGIPHVSATGFRGLGYGYGYAMAQLDPCAMFDMFATFSGQRSLRYGPDGTDLVRMLGRRPITNRASDSVRQLLVDDAQLSAAKATMSPDIRALVAGYAAGFNRYMAQTPVTNLPAICRKDSPIPAVTPDDVLRRVAGVSSLLSAGLYLQEIYDAAPPNSGVAAAPPGERAFAAIEPASAGSNAYAFGRDLTGGAGLLLGNPHFFWDGPDRFVEAHLTIPGRYDVMGASLLGLPLINIGFNASLAWTHTVSTDDRGAVYALRLDPHDPTRYLVDGASVAMTKRRISIQMRRADGTIRREYHDFWLTRFGPVVMNGALPWTHEVAYALRDANRGNFRLLQQWLTIGESRNVDALRSGLARIEGLPWMNTIAADAAGGALYANISVAPDLDATRLAQCRTNLNFGLSAYLVALDGTRTACDWKNDTRSAQDGILPGTARPFLRRTDYVENSNGSHWIVNPAEPIEGFSPIVGAERTPLNFRSRQGHVQVADRLSGRDGLPGRLMTPLAMEAILASGRSLQAEATVDALVGACRASPIVTLKDGERVALGNACDTLARWDRRFTLDSAGGHLFSAFVARAKLPGTEDLGENPALWRVPFDPADPIGTPRDLAIDNPAVLMALGEAVRSLGRAGIPLDAKLRDIQFATRGELRIPLPGGATFSALSATLRKGVGFTDPINPSNSYIQIVTFAHGRPVADAVLASSQSSDPASPFYADQTLLYSQQRWIRLPFTAAAIRAEAAAPATVLTVPRP